MSDGVVALEIAQRNLRVPRVPAKIARPGDRGAAAAGNRAKRDSASELLYRFASPQPSAGRKRKLMRQLVKLVLLGSSLAACLHKGDGTDVDSAESAVDSSESTEAEGDLVMANLDGVATTGVAALTGDDAAARIATNIAARWTDGCATVVQSGANITVTYHNCTGPRGLVHVTGELDLAISVSPTGAIAVHATSDDMQVNRASISFTADATYTVTGTAHELAVQTNGSGTGPLGNQIEHEGNYTISWDTASACRSIQGTWHTDLGSLERSNDVDVQRCGDTGCPTGTVTHHYIGGASIEVTFDGTAVATWSGSGGRSGTVTLDCQ
jgi:hypothetical protein